MKALIFAMCCLVSIRALSAEPSVVQIGRTYPIIERDAMLEIEERAANAPSPSEALGDPKDWTAFQSIRLPVSQETKSRWYIPWAVTQFDITDGKGNVIYPKGFRFNPAQYIGLGRQRLVIFSQDQLPLIRPFIRKTDMLILSGGSVLETMKALDNSHQVMVLREEFIDRFDIKVVPTVLEQPLGEARFYIQEYAPADLERRLSSASDLARREERD